MNTADEVDQGEDDEDDDQEEEHKEEHEERHKEEQRVLDKHVTRSRARA